jgi:type VI protein secretion system component Hcp
MPSGADGSVGMENVTINCEAVEFEYTPQGSDGKPQGAVTMKWNFKENKEG